MKIATKASAWTPTGSFLTDVPSLRRHEPAFQSLIVRADFGYSHTTIRMAFDVATTSDFLDLHEALIVANRFDGDHLAKFVIPKKTTGPGGGLLTHGGDLRRGSEGDLVFGVPFIHGDSICEPWWWRYDDDGTVDPAYGAIVSEHLGMGGKALWNYDFGDDWWFTLRVIGVGPPRVGGIKILRDPESVLIEYERVIVANNDAAIEKAWDDADKRRELEG